MPGVAVDILFSHASRINEFFGGSEVGVKQP